MPHQGICEEDDDHVHKEKLIKKRLLHSLMERDAPSRNLYQKRCRSERWAVNPSFPTVCADPNKIRPLSTCSIRIRRGLRSYCSGSVALRFGGRFISQNPKLLLGNHFAENQGMCSCRVARRCVGRSIHPFRLSTKNPKTPQKQFVPLNMYDGVLEESPRRTLLIPLWSAMPHQGICEEGDDHVHEIKLLETKGS